MDSIEDNKYTPSLAQIIASSQDEAARLGCNTIGPEHLLLAILRDNDNKAKDILQNSLKINLRELTSKIEQKTQQSTIADKATVSGFNQETYSVMRLIILEARLAKTPLADIDHLLMAIVRHKNNIPARILSEEFNIDYQSLHNAMAKSKPVPKASSIDFEDDFDTQKSSSDNTSQPKSNQQPVNSDTPAIDSFGFDLTKAAADGILDPVVGRESEIERLAQILVRRKKNNPVLIGEPGVGKSAIVEGLALHIVERRVSPVLFDKRIVSLDLASVVAGTKYRGQFEERMRNIINELKANRNIIIFIDEIHTIVGAGNQAGQMDAANMMKPALSRGELQCIGATTLDEYRKNIEKDGALERRFQKILVEQTTPEETLTILRNIQSRYEEHHNVHYTDDALEACVQLPKRYISDRTFPDKAIDVLDEAGARAHITICDVPKDVILLKETIAENKKRKEQAIKNGDYVLASNFRTRVIEGEKQMNELMKQWRESIANAPETVDADKVAEAVSIMTGIPVQKMMNSETTRLREMRSTMKNIIISQDTAIDKLVNAVQRSRIGIKDPSRPIGVFMFLGPTGVGKTHTAKQLAQQLFASSDALIRIDMSEYMEKFTVSRLVGAPPGYVGYDEGGTLTERVRRKPYSVILLDEIEKAHTDIYNLLLQVMDDGRLTDSVGRTVDFRNTVIIMTSNVGSRQLKEFGRGVGFSHITQSSDSSLERSVIQKALNRQFSPEFLNRIDEIITFDSLDRNAILKIAGLELKKLVERLATMRYKLNIDEIAIEYIADQAYDVQYGARPLRRYIQSNIEDRIAQLIIEQGITEGTEITVTCNNNELVIE